MTKKTKTTKKDATAQPANGAARGKGEKEQPLFRCLGQGVKDLSFECPIPAYVAGEAPQAMDFNLAVRVSKRQEPANTWEVHLALRAQADVQAEDKPLTLFLAELAYGGVFIVEHIEGESRDLLLHVEAAALLYPFARQLLMDMVAAGGYRPPLLEPVNFMGLYQQHARQQAGQSVPGTAKAAAQEN
jgi:preprotein translocase subunit SecB